jgi:hypothetical protein
MGRRMTNEVKRRMRTVENEECGGYGRERIRIT